MPMAAVSDLADLFAELWQRFAHELAAFEAALEALGLRRTEGLASATHLDGVLSSQGLASVPTLRDWLGGRGAAVPGSEMERAVLVAQAIDRWYAPLLPESDREASRAVD